ncbi:MAG: FGGY family carbohydrate kinase [Sphaerochaetaceae bacterium]
MKQYVITLDLGTSGFKLGLISEELEVVYSTYQSVRSNDLSTNLDLIIAMLKHLDTEKFPVCGITLSGQMGGVVAVDSNFNPLTPFDSGLDVRCEKYNHLLHATLQEELYEVTCGSPRNTPKIMWWKNERPEVYRKVAKFVPLHTYMAGKMCGLRGEEAVIDHTMLAFWGNENIARLDWWLEGSKALSLELEKFPQVVSPFSFLGSVSREFANLSGIKAGTPLYVGAGDQSAGLYGMGFNRPNLTLEVSGSSTLLFTTTAKHIADTSGTIIYLPALFEGLYYSCSYINGGGINLPWFKNLVDSSADEAAFYKEMGQRASQIDIGSHGLLFNPYLGGRQCPYDSAMKGAFLGLTLEHTTDHLYRSILESIAYAHLIGKERMEELFDLSIETIYCCGGGAKDPLWNQIKASVLSSTVQPLQSYEGNLIGNALIALVGCKIVTLEESINRPIRPTGTPFTPLKSEQARYRPYSELFKNLDTLSYQAISHALSELSQD